MEVVQRIDARRGIVDLLTQRPAWQRWAVYTGLVGMTLFFGSYYNTTQFIYFQF